jgi:hypothetical protein
MNNDLQIQRALEIITRWIHTLRTPLCEDCGFEPAVRTFLHLRGTEHRLCTECYMSADHDDDYLQ